ncbi:unnamed protein product [Hermetia illucens]|uniref:BHLH domain-containing protein n=1 Tax=Hermetia illucens TaxID=343691 RepID=A0A7R8YP36_HERIL|nr:uncharacterized protein LOC119646592 [Hermetia illucens]CAD7079906.1 unnamed protein product [Hermetia illucens]
MAAENPFAKLSASDLSAIILKGAQMTTDRDTGFCSGSSETGDELSPMDHSRLEPHSPTDASEDSVEVKVTPITLTRNKRKSTEPSRVICEQETGPLKKRIRYVPGQCKEETDTRNPFRPWDQQMPHEVMPNPAEVLIRHPGVTTLHRTPYDDVESTQDEPLALVAKKPSSSLPAPHNATTSHIGLNEETNNNLSNLQHGDKSMKFQNTASCSSTSLMASMSLRAGTSSSSSSVGSQRPQQRNYKNMTRERRIEANARERTRVHTISAAYDTLRKSIPSYSNTQKLSKLSVLRVACSYILTLSRMAGFDYSADQSSPSVAECMDMVTKTIQTEGKIRKKKDE